MAERQRRLELAALETLGRVERALRNRFGVEVIPIRVRDAIVDGLNATVRAVLIEPEPEDEPTNPRAPIPKRPPQQTMELQPHELREVMDWSLEVTKVHQYPWDRKRG